MGFADQFADRLATVRKERGFSQAQVRQRLELKGDAYGRYERGEVKPSIEMAAQIAQALDVSLDYLVGLTDEAFDQNTLRRMADVRRLSEEQRRQVYLLLDALLRDFKARRLYEEAA